MARAAIVLVLLVLRPYTGQQASLLGRLDPVTGQIREYPLPSAASGPHGLVADRDGNIWFTGNAPGYIGKLDPVSGRVTEYPLRDPRARDPHTLIFDQSGILWFTVQHGNFVGKLDPRTGEITLRSSPTPNSLPYGIVINSKGIPFYSEFGTNKIASINPATFEITE
jgi:virginiamycin B lyase